MNELYFDEEGRDKLINGIKKISKAVKSTLGPLGNTVILESNNHTRGLTITKDGVTVAKSINLEDPVENLAVRMVKEAADRTATSAGDGTTTAIVLTEAIVLEGMSKLEVGVNVSELARRDPAPGVGSPEVRRELRQALSGKFDEHSALVNAERRQVGSAMLGPL